MYQLLKIFNIIFEKIKEYLICTDDFYSSLINFVKITEMF